MPNIQLTDAQAAALLEAAERYHILEVNNMLGMKSWKPLHATSFGNALYAMRVKVEGMMDISVPFIHQ